MREHCYHGYVILKKIPFLNEAAEIVYSHQEHFDGTGYPRGLKGERDSSRRAHVLGGRHARCHHFGPAYRPAQSLDRGPG